MISLKTVRRVVACSAVAACVCVASCGTIKGLAGGVTSLVKSEETPQLSQEEFGQHLDVYSDYFAAAIGTAARELALSSSDPQEQRSALAWRLQSVRTVRNAILVEEPQLGFLDVWVFCVQQREYMETAGIDRFGEGGEVALSAARDVERKIAEVGALFLVPAQLEEAREDVETFAAEHPLQGKFARAASLPSSAPTSERGDLNWVLAVPMSPFKVFSGLDEGAAAVRHFSNVTERFARRFDNLPQETVWELQLLMMDIEQRPMVQRNTESFASFAESVGRLVETSDELAATARGLPADVREEVQTVIDQLDTKQADLRLTIDKANEMVERTSGALAEVEGVAKSSRHITP